MAYILCYKSSYLSQLSLRPTKPWDGVKSIRGDISIKRHVNVGDSLGSIRTLTVTPCVEVVAVWTVPGAMSPGCILAEPRKGDKLTPGGNESGGFGANKRNDNVGNVHA